MGARHEQRNGPYDAEGLEDEALSLIYNPENHAHQNIKKGPNLFNHVHPNCLVFAEDGRLFVGDSDGVIHSWTIVFSKEKLYPNDHFKIEHKELEGDQINALIMHPHLQKHIYVHSRDNCIRLVEYESVRGTRVKKRFFGSKCKDMTV